jgi:hypothetical protein
LARSMRREQQERRDLLSSPVSPSAGSAPIHRATIRFFLLAASAFMKACGWLGCLRADVRP